MGTIDEALQAVATELHLHRKVMLDHYQREQLNQATQTAGIGNAYSMNLLNPVLPSPQALMILPRNDRRKEIVLINYGPADLIYDTQVFDPLSIESQISDILDPSPGFNMAPNVLTSVAILKAGTQILIKCSSSLWAYSLGSNQGAPSASLLSMFETTFNTPSARPSAGERVDQAGLDYGGKMTPQYAMESAIGASNRDIP